ncbi:MAG: hypothetical protein ACREXV_06970 [Polaromonas sp.]
MNPIEDGRRRLLKAMAASTLAAARPALATASIDQRDPATGEIPPAGADPLSGEALFRDVEHYAALGEHRTAGAADLRTSRWIAAELGAAGFDVALKPFKLSQYFNETTQLHVGEVEVPAFPHWFPRPTGKTPVRAPLALIGTDPLQGRIAYLAPQDAGPWYRVDVSQWAQRAAAGGALALIVAVPHPSGGIYARNAAEPYLKDGVPIPTVVVPAASDALLAKARGRGQEVSLLIDGRIDPQATAFNVIASRNAGTGRRWVVVSTPSSGWFRCAGERGTGVALFLGLARWIAASHPHDAILFIASSGHELDFMGARLAFREAPPPEAVSLWLHLGASIGARRWQVDGDRVTPMDKGHESSRLFASPQPLAQARQAFANVPDLHLTPSDMLSSSGGGELTHIVQDGYSAAGMVGDHRYFHTPLDLPTVTSPELLAPYGRAFSLLITSFVGQKASS